MMTNDIRFAKWFLAALAAGASTAALIINLIYWSFGQGVSGTQLFVVAVFVAVAIETAWIGMDRWE